MTAAAPRPEPEYVLTRDGQHIMTARYFDCMQYVHRVHSCSFDWACKYEGYRCEPVAPAAVAR